ncbi:S1 RNA-binding domain-containing protein [bacterium]|nr:S1 RNA-binding domain-containing protein [bacterium]
MNPLAVGDIVDAVVTRLEPYGAWVEADGRTGLIRIPEISWSRISHPKDVLAVGQGVRAVVLQVGGADGFNGSIRAVHPERDPWFDPTVFAAGAEFDAPVVRVMEYGYFLELRPDVWGLLRRECWAGAFTVGDRLRVRVVSSDTQTRKVEVEPVATPGAGSGVIP